MMNESEQKMYDAIYQENMRLKDQLEHNDEKIEEIGNKYGVALNVIKMLIGLIS